ncbi:MAG: hypothetical protein SVU32_01000, partial [Candidatus Nanohaloarchaea archaeon]|nr:hypothetical protein [Candidatus Nanohaloarchaea archaeon]
MLDYRRVLVDAVDAFDAEHGTETPVPQLEIVENGYTPAEQMGGDEVELVSQTAYRITVSDDAVIGEEGCQEWTEERLSEYYQDCLREIYGQAAAARLEESVGELEERYSPFDPSIEIDAVAFREGRSNAAYNRGDALVKLPVSYLDDIDPRDATLASENRRSTFMHEAAHALQFGTNRHAGVLADHVTDTKDGEYKEDVRRAAIEAITKYEEPLPGSSRIDHERTVEALTDPWRLPDLDVRPEGRYSDDPYELGHLAAYAIDTAFTEQYEEELAEELTREFLLNAVTTPTGLEGAIDRSFEIREVPNYPARFQHWYEELGGAE